MTKSYCSLQQSGASSVESTTNESIQTSHHSPFLQQLVDVFDHVMSSFLFQVAPSFLRQVLHVNIVGDVVKRVLHKGYDNPKASESVKRFMMHGYQLKMLKALPSSWSQISLVMRTKPGVDNLNFNDLYNNLRAFEADVKGSTGSSSSTQNIAFVSSESANSTNDVAMISMTLKKFHNKLGRKIQFDAKEPVGFDKTKVECYNCHKTGHFARECRSKRNQDNKRKDAWNSGYKAKDNGRRPGKQEESNALITLDGEGIDWTTHAEDEEDNFALMAFSNSGLDTEDDPHKALKNKGIVDNGCSRHMTGKKAYLVDYQDYIVRP
ncbi:ribonuclease H-like domain-containing protein [Tanacetum coccineum]